MAHRGRLCRLDRLQPNRSVLAVLVALSSVIGGSSIVASSRGPAKADVGDHSGAFTSAIPPQSDVSPACTNCVIANVPVGSYPSGVTYDTGARAAYVTNYLSNNVSVISDSSNSVVDTIPVASPGGVTYDPARGEVFVADYDYESGGNVSVISDATNKVVATIPVGDEPRALAYDPPMGEIFVADQGSGGPVPYGNVSVISDTTDRVVATIPVGLGTGALAYDGSNGDIYVADYNSNQVAVLAPTTNTVLTTIPVGEGPSGVAYDPADGDVYVTNGGVTNVSVISGNTNKVVTSVGLSPSNCGPTGLAYDGGNAEIYVALQCGTRHGPVLDNVSVISGANNTVVATIPVGINPTGVAYDNVLGYVYVTNQATNNTSVIRTPTPTKGTGPATLFGLPTLVVDLVLGGILAVAVIAAVALRLRPRRKKVLPIHEAAPPPSAKGDRSGPPG